MRPSTAISADGPANLLEAVTLAATPDAKNRGAMMVLNDRIGSAWYTEKTNGNTLDTFKAVEQGYIGGFLSTVPFFYYPAAQPTFKQTFDVSNITELPKVDVLYGYVTCSLSL
jgi:L-asparaginase